MAGHPLRAALVADLSKRAVAAGVAIYDDTGRVHTERSADAYALAWLAGGAPPGRSPTLLALAREMNVSYPLMHKWLTRTPEARDRLSIAREECAAFLTDEAVEILDTASATEGGLARARAEFRKWLAGKYDRKTFGDSAGPTVAISLGSLHLQAIAEARTARQVGKPAGRSELIALPDVAEVDAPILIEDNDLEPEDLL